MHNTTRLFTLIFVFASLFVASNCANPCATSPCASPKPTSVSGARSALQTIASDYKCSTAIQPFQTTTASDSDRCKRLSDCEQKIEQDLNKANQQAPSWPTPSTAEAKDLISYMNETLAPAIDGFLQGFSDCKTYWQRSGLIAAYKNNLNTLKNGTETLANVILGKVSDATTKSQGQSVLSRIDAAFNKAIANFS